MAFLKTINVWADGVQADIMSGKLKIQTGQWLRCGTTGKRCRYVGHTERSINAVHWQGSGKATNDLFKRRVVKKECFKSR